MKKSKVVNLVLVAGLLTACSGHKEQKPNSRLFVRGDSASQYTRSPHTGMGHFFYFGPFGNYHPYYGYRHSGYESSGFSSKAGSAHISRGGFGSSGVHVGS